MKALTIWQPWASLILIGAKPYEFRSWEPPRSIIGQRIAVHAGARPAKASEVWDLLDRLVSEHDDAPCLHPEIALPALARMKENLGCLPLGHVLCTAVLGKPKRGDDCAREFDTEFGNDSEREGTFNWGWPLTEIEPLEPPVPARGRQGFWNWAP